MLSRLVCRRNRGANGSKKAASSGSASGEALGTLLIFMLHSTTETNKVVLGRSMLECIEILSIATEKGLHIYAVKGNWRLDGSIQSKIIAMAFAIAAEIERDLISQRTTEALQARKQQGMPLGRPKGIGKSKLDDHRIEIEALLKNRSTKTWGANKYQTTVGNLRHWMKQHGIIMK